MSKILAVALLSLFLISCDAPNNLKVVEEMSWLNQADPLEDFETAIARSDFRFIGLYGVGARVPIVNIKCLDFDKDINFIKGTTDAMENYEHEKLNAIAGVYARRYNLRMFIYLTEHKGFECAL